MKLLTPEHWKSYELIDSGNYKKLEKFGEFILSRPEPQAVWDPSMREDEWNRMNNAAFVKKKEEGHKNFDSERGEWVLKKGMQQQWLMPYSYKDMHLKFRLGLSSFKHVGIFPEQASNWDYIYDTVKAMPGKPKVLNLFAYTGGASIAAKAAGADVTHVDSVKQVISWSRENMVASQLTDIRWVVEDAMKFVQREVKRGNTYQGIILDPPAYGRGPSGEKWVIEEHLNQMLKLCAELLDRENYFFIINLYSIGFSALILETFTRQLFGGRKNMEIGELYLQDRFNKKLPLGVFSRFSSVKR
jgi:23S rRNA (cytosine1962-C5)-methyltransferase